MRRMTAPGSRASSPARPPSWWNLPARPRISSASLQRAPKKVLVLDLDNTLWGGVVADDGIEGIEIGDTSPRGEAFKAFQKYIASLKQRGVLLAVCSKNDHAKAAEVFEKHPEMVLRMEDFVSFKANWEPKSDNIRQMAAELNLGLDSFVFVDDNPAEIEIVRQFAPEVDDDPPWARSCRITSRNSGLPVLRTAKHHRRGCRPHRPVPLRGAAQGAGRGSHGHGFLPGIAGDGSRDQRIHARGCPPAVATDQQEQPVQSHDPPPHRGGAARADGRSRLRRVFHAPQGSLWRPRVDLHSHRAEERAQP